MAEGITNKPFYGLECIYKGTIASNNSINISGYESRPHDAYIVASGTWNHSSILAVFPNNGEQPIVREIAKFNDITCSITSYGNWGITVTNNSTVSSPYTIFRIDKSVG